MSENVIEITDELFSTEVLSSPIPVIVDFSGEWCGPCKMLAPIFADLASEYRDKIKFVRVDVDNCPRTASMYNINSVPTLLFIRDGKIVEQHTGLLAKAPFKAKIEKVFTLSGL